MNVNAAELLSEIPTQNEVDEVVEYVMKNVKFDGNMRGSKEYRQILAKVFINRAISEITGLSAEYQYMPTCAYNIGTMTVDKEGTLHCEDGTNIDGLLDK